ncbi:hemicentin-1-like [Microplitis mediator]|uniref:hemicentin-1-like n=1 Tax=Microplitis mediator TaxID=375433 RepID=UPI002556424D|nr:hemicentin-1-like [Microplitis mediator]
MKDSSHSWVVAWSSISEYYTAKIYDELVHFREGEPTKYLSLGKEISYNETLGFTLHNISSKNAKTYACDVKPDRDQLKARLKVEVPDTESGLFRTSSSLYITSYPPKQMSVGDNYQLNCTIYGNFSFTENLFQWLTPRQGKPKTRFIIEPGTYAPSYTNELTIENVTNEDVGEYKCHFYGFSILRLIKVNLKLHTKKYLNISKSPSNQYKQIIGQDIKWKVDVAAYPLPSFKWLDPKGREIDNDWSFHNYKINGEHFEITLLKSNLVFEDRGNYTLIATNSEKTETINFFLDVLLEPFITKRAQEEVKKITKNEELEFKCEAEGYPLPTITWSYSNSFDSSTFATEKNDRFNEVVTPIDIKKVISTIKLNVQNTGKLTCKACNHLSCDSYVVKTINVPAIDQLFVNIPFIQYEFFGYMLKVNVGDDVTIPCRPTSLEYQVELSTRGHKLQPNNSLLYDPRKGFTIKNFHSDSPKFYDCVINPNGKAQSEKNQKSFNIFLSDKWDQLETPKITTNSLTHMELGKDFSLNCTVPAIYQSSGTFVNWFIPKLSNRATTKLFREITVDIFHTAILELTIKNVTLEDVGEYVCYAYEYPVIRTETINLALHSWILKDRR